MSTFKYTKVFCPNCGTKRWVTSVGSCATCLRKRLVDIREAHKHRSPKNRPPEVVVAYKMWKQRDGTLARIKDMDDHHLVATIRHCERRADARHKREVAKFPAAAAGVCLKIGINPLFLCKQYEDLVFESKVRGIDLRIGATK